jgi:hypothetical protein
MLPNLSVKVPNKLFTIKNVLLLHALFYIIVSGNKKEEGKFI